MLSQEFGDDAGRDARVGKAAVQVQTRGDDGGLDRVQHVEAGCHVAKAMPGFAGGGFAQALGALQNPVICPAHALFGQFVRPPDFEPPLVVAEFVVDLAHCTAEIERLQDALLHQRTSTGRLHHGSSHVAARDDGVLRAGAGVHQVGLVEQVAVQFSRLRVLHQHVAGLADACQQFVDGLRGVNH